nr:hypothetical protein [Lysinibacillus sphaericus]
MTNDNNPVQDDKEKSIPIWVYILAGIAILFVVPSAFAGLMTIDFFSKAPGGTDGWLSYWGAYLGGIIGMIAVVATTQYIVSNQNKQQKKQMQKHSEQHKDLLDNQNMKHEEQMREQNKQHLNLLESQNSHHQEQLDEQRKGIERAAELNDQTERSRIYTTFLLNKNEELIHIVTELFELNNTRFNLLRKYLSYSEKMSYLISQKKESETNELLDGNDKNEKIEKLRNEFQSIKTKRLQVLDEETIIRGKMIPLSAKLKSASMYFTEFELDTNKYRDTLTDSIDTLHSKIDNEKDSDEKFESIKEIIDNDQKQNRENSNTIIALYRSNIDKIFNDFLSNKKS